MPQMETAQIVQLIAWIIALFVTIMGLYIFLLNIRNPANRHVSVLLLIISANTYAQGITYTAQQISQVQNPLIILAATTPAIQPGLLLTAIVLLRPQWLRGRWKYAWWLIYGLVILPIALTAFDYLFQTPLYYSGFTSVTYLGGFVNLQYFTDGFLGLPIRIISIYLIPIVTIFTIGYVAFFDKSITRFTRNLAITLFVTQVLALIINFTLFASPLSSFSILATSVIFVIVYTYAAFWQLISERRVQSGRLQIRLSAVILSISVPILIAISTFVITQASDFIRQIAIHRLEDSSTSISTAVNTWLDLNNRALDALVNMPEIVSMEPARQKPILERMADTYGYMYLISTLDLNGFNVARNDDIPLKDYSDRSYFQSIVAGESEAQQTVIGKTIGKPALVVAKPIKNNFDQLVGVGFFASTLETLSEVIQIGALGSTGEAFIVDSNNQIIAHPDPRYTSEELRDFSKNPVVASMRQADSGDLIRYTGNDGVLLYGFHHELDNGWGVIVQQAEADFLGTIEDFQTVVIIIIIVGVVVLGSLTTLAIRQAIQPIEALTETAVAITKGDLERIAPIESEDEIGVLAHSFNQMTGQLLESINNLELSVAERTRDLEERSIELQSAADVGRAASSILDKDQLIQEVVEMIRERFDFYYVGLFIVGEDREWAYLQAGTGEAGKAMLARGHRIKIGEGMVGWSIANARSRIALEAEIDEVRVSTPELPETRSEAAIPLEVRGLVTGAISIQDIHQDAFDDARLSTLQTLADLVSVAIDNARLYTESQQSLEVSQRLYGEMSSKAWHEQVQSVFGFSSSERGTIAYKELDNNQSSINLDDTADKVPLSVPIKIRDTVIGELNTYKSGENNQWHPEEISMIETIIDQIGVALESARLYQGTQQSAARERLVSEITTKIRASTDPREMLQTAVSELQDAFKAKRGQVLLPSKEGDKASGENLTS